MAPLAARIPLAFSIPRHGGSWAKARFFLIFFSLEKATADRPEGVHDRGRKRGKEEELRVRFFFTCSFRRPQGVPFFSPSLA